ncbi:MAG: hypothetical protein HY459_03215 [Parcubacteria group bacterium]|nr:hypothetical protein [Parcubacteria group bacterium]
MSTSDLTEVLRQLKQIRGDVAEVRREMATKEEFKELKVQAILKYVKSS